MNPLLQSINNQTTMNNINELGKMLNMFKNSSNPMMVFEQIAIQNPSMQPIIAALRNGASAEQVFRSECNKRGINADQFIASLQGK